MKFPSEMSFRSVVLDTDAILVRGSSGNPQYTTPAAIMAGRSLTIGTSSTTAARGDQGLTAYNHSQATHAPTNAQKNSDITKAEIEAKVGTIPTSYAPTNAQKNSDITKTEIEAKLTGAITTHNHALPLTSNAAVGYTPSDYDLIWIEKSGIKYQWTWLGLKESMKAYIDASPATPDPNSIYVSTNGSDSNAGTLISPYLTFAKAVSVATAGKTVIFEDGTYTVSSGTMATLSASGNSSNYITYRARNKGGAILDGGNTALFCLSVSGSYLNIEGFEIRWFASDSMATPSGASCQYVNFRDLHIHHCGRVGIDSSAPNAQTGVGGTFFHDLNHSIIERCLFHDIGRLSPAEGFSAATGILAFDHAIYMSGCSYITIQNNIFYNCNRGFAVQLYGDTYNNDHISVINNTMVDGNPQHYAGHIMLWSSMSNILIANNIMDGHYDYAMQLFQDGYTYSNVIITKNIANGGNGLFMVYSTLNGVALSNNLAATDPLFVGRSTHDYHLSSGSPCIASGYATGVATDYINNTRVNNDIGAYKY